MTEPRPIGMERLLAQAARLVSGNALHPAELLQRVQAAFEAGIRDGFGPNDIRVGLSPHDYASYEPMLADLGTEVRAAIARVRARTGCRFLGDVSVHVERADGAADGAPDVMVRFRETTYRAAEPAAGATRRLVRHSDYVLLVDGQAVALTHTPLSIGRGAGNDLVLPSMAVSRHHAELTLDERGFVLTDLGSRNGIVVNGERIREAVLAPGVRAVLGDIVIELRERQARDG
jgi:hypothetical protein